MTDQPTAPPGWYPENGMQRYWDGRAWTDHVAPAHAPPTYRQPQNTLAHIYAPTPQRVTGLVQGTSGMMPAMQVAPKNPALALIASFFIPGLGTMINGQGGKGAMILVGYVVSWLLTFVLIGIPGLIGFWVWGMVDAYQGAQKWNARHGILS